MISREDIKKFTGGGKFYAAWKRVDGTLAFYSGRMSDLPVRGKLTDDRFLLEHTDKDDKMHIKTVIIPNIIFVATEEGKEVLENMPLDKKGVA